MPGPYIYDRVKETTTTTGTGTYTLAGAATGFRSFSAVGNGNTCFYCAENGTDWEVGVGTYTSLGTTLSRDEILASSNSGSAVNWSSGTKNIFITHPAAYMLEQQIPSEPGGRLTVTSGTAVTTTDVTSAGTIYYTPHRNGRVDLWNGRRWVTVLFTQKSIVFLGLTSGKNYDVFGYLSSGDLAIEALVWTDDTNRATGITMTDGLWTKSGDQTRLYLGTFRTTSTTTTEDSKAKRFVWNAYNRVPYRDWRDETANSWTDAGNGTWSAINGGSSVWKHEFVRGLNVEPIKGTVIMTGGPFYSSAVSLDSSGAPDRSKGSFAYQDAAGAVSCPAVFLDFPSVGYHYLQGVETTFNATSRTAYGDNGATVGGGIGGIQSGFVTEGFR